MTPNEIKQTAVNWLVDQIKSDQNQKALSASQWMQVIEKAKEMEKEQIVDAHIEGQRVGRKVFTIINHGGLNSIVELEAAIRAGEIVAINSLNVEPKKEPQVVVVKESSVSVADELKKLKQLLNDSTITQEEYDKMKAKLLGQ